MSAGKAWIVYTNSYGLHLEPGRTAVLYPDCRWAGRVTGSEGVSLDPLSPSLALLRGGG